MQWPLVSDGFSPVHRDVWAASDIQSSDKEDMMIGKESTRALNCSQTPQILEVCSSQHQPWNRNTKTNTKQIQIHNFFTSGCSSRHQPWNRNTKTNTQIQIHKFFTSGCSSRHQPWNRNAKIQTHKYKYIQYNT